MRALNIALLLVGIPFMIMEAKSLLKDKSKTISFNKWEDQPKRTFPFSIPIEAILDESTIELRFLQNVDEQVIFQVKDLYGNIILQDIVVPVEQEIHTIDVSGLEAGSYELFYIEGGLILFGEFNIESQIPFE
ncbi:DUF3244 domain-containing protein [Bacteroides sp. UBA939]|uniref:DUF3244 domain-containing protein n=1 Tax=Bacteroides sp. UBA939 TaxID=1946092 RepID=UPI0025C057A1|nr:DUF3244 domain-containing protein [Bacteroides sp. UBA939]